MPCLQSITIFLLILPSQCLFLDPFLHIHISKITQQCSLMYLGLIWRISRPTQSLEGLLFVVFNQTFILILETTTKPISSLTMCKLQKVLPFGITRLFSVAAWARCEVYRLLRGRAPVGNPDRVLVRGWAISTHFLTRVQPHRGKMPGLRQTNSQVRKGPSLD